MTALNQSLIGRRLPAGMRHTDPTKEATITIVAVRVSTNEFWHQDGPVIECELKWDTGNPTLDDENSVGSLAPGTMLWDQLSAQGPIRNSER